MTTSMNERTHFFIKLYLSHFILKRVDVSCVWEVSWRRRQTAKYWAKVLLATIAVLHPHLGSAAQPWVAEGPSTLSGAGSHSAGILSPTATGTELTNSIRLWHDIIVWRPPASCGRAHLHRIQPQVKVIFRYLRPDAPVSLLHRWISWLTARSRVNMLYDYCSWNVDIGYMSFGDGKERAVPRHYCFETSGMFRQFTTFPLKHNLEERSFWLIHTRVSQRFCHILVVRARL